MDKNKKSKLASLGYKVNKCCGNCFHGDIREYRNWGTCGKHTHHHLKHTGKNRNMSINRYGCCDEYVMANGFMYSIEPWSEFLVE